jgi:hypothetical protein
MMVLTTPRPVSVQILDAFRRIKNVFSVRSLCMCLRNELVTVIALPFLMYRKLPAPVAGTKHAWYLRINMLLIR